MIKLFGNYYGAARSRQFIGDDASSDKAVSRNLDVLNQYFGRTVGNVNEDDIHVDTDDPDVSDVILDYRLMLDNVSSVISDIGCVMSSAVKSVSKLFSQTLTSVIPPNNNLDTKQTLEADNKDVELSANAANSNDPASTSALMAEPEDSVVERPAGYTNSNDPASTSALMAETEASSVVVPTDGTNSNDPASTSALMAEPEASTVVIATDGTNSNYPASTSELMAEPEASTVVIATEGTSAVSVVMSTALKHPRNVNCCLLQALGAVQFHLRYTNEQIYYNPDFAYQYEHSNRISFGYCNGDELPHIVKMSSHTSEVVRYTRVHRKVSGVEYNWKCFDRVKPARGEKRGTNLVYLGSITLKDQPGNIQNYFLNKQMEYDTKSYYYYVKAICISDVSIIVLNYSL